MTAATRYLRGQAHPAARLTEKQALKIKRSTDPTKELAERYGVSIETVKNIRYRRRWKHLPD